MIERGSVEDGVFTTEYAELGQLAGWVLRQEGRARPLAPPELVDARPRGHRQGRSSATKASRRSRRGQPRRDRRPSRSSGRPVPSRPSASASSRRCSPSCSQAAGTRRPARIPADELVERFKIPADQLDDHLQLLNLVNFGGGCYAVYAALEDDEVYVEKELFGDTFRRPPRLTPLEARAIRLALEFVGPMIAAEAHTPLERVRRKLEETFGEFDVDERPERAGGHSRGAAHRDALAGEHRAPRSSRSSTPPSARRRASA